MLVQNTDNFHLIQGKDSPLQIILLMIKMQFDDLISLKAHTNLMLMNLKVEKLDIGIGNSMFTVLHINSNWFLLLLPKTMMIVCGFLIKYPSC